MPAKQAERPAEVITPLGEDVLLLQNMTVTEQLGRLFEVTLELLSEDSSINIPDILGQNVTVRFDLPDDVKRYFNGFVSSFCQVGMLGRYNRYQAIVRPWPWFLTRTSDCRIFQDKAVPDIIKQIFQEYSFTDFEDKLTGSYRTWNYCVQYRETDFNFVSRLIEQEGFYYYFKHENGKHTLILADSYSAHEPVPGYEEIPYYPLEEAAIRERDHIYDWCILQTVQPVDYTLDAFDFERPRSDLTVKSSISRKHDQASYEMYDYPGEYIQTGDGDGYVRARIEELQAQYEQLTGQGNARGLASGALFTLTGYPREDQDREVLVTSATHTLQVAGYESGAAQDDNVYNCSFTAMDAKETYRSPRTTPKPVVQGPQTAVVVGPSGKEIWTDKHGRVKAQFHWDREGKMDENSSCWMRVSQVHAGKGFGGIDIPRIGEEVIVSFLEGDPDQPIITGRVYNGDNKPPTGLPGAGMLSGLKSNSTPGGGGDNTIMLDDTKGNEKLTVHGQYNMDTTVGNNQTNDVGVDQTNTVGSNQKEDVGANREVSIGADDKLTVKANRTMSVGASEKVTINATSTLNVGAKRTVTIGASDELSVTGTLKVGAQGAIEISSPASITLTVGGSTVKIEPASVSIMSTMITFEGSAKVETKGAMVTSQASGINEIAGATVKIN